MSLHHNNSWIAKYLDKIFSSVVLFTLNAGIIAIIILLGWQEFFEENGIVHFLAVFFVLLAVLRSFFHYYSHDPILEKFIHGTAIAFIIASISHLFEFFAEHSFKLSDEVVFSVVAYFYFLSLITLTIGADITLFSATRKNKTEIIILGFLAVVVSLVIFISFINNNFILLLLKANVLLPVYIILAAIIGLLAYIRISEIGHILPYVGNFVRYNKLAVALIICSNLLEIFHEKSEKFGISEEPISYVSHIMFYIALSTVFISFRALANRQGIYDNELIN